MRLDRRGRRIGRNTWREYVLDVYRPARHAWELGREEHCSGYATEEREYALEFPGPTLKATLIGLRGTWTGK